MWLALCLKKEAEISVLGREVKLPFKDMADGCVGCLLAFDTKEAAAEYAGENVAIVQIEYVQKPDVRKNEGI
jgi:hypothetical protein